MSDEQAKAPSREQIELHAYQIYTERGRLEGHDLADWLKAERELTRESQSAVPDLATSDSSRTAAPKSRHSTAA